MDFIRKYDIELQKEHYYAGETLHGWVVIENLENLRVTGVQVFLRGKAHVEWRITRGGERRTVKEDQYFIDEKVVVWGKDNDDDGSISIMPRGDHRFPFEFQLPASCLPCSFESRVGTVRYYLRVIIDIPYASPPQGLKYFTVIGPYIDCLDEKYITPQSASKQITNNCLCCTSGPISLEAWLERAAYCCGENIKLKCEIQNGSDQDVSLFCRLFQNVEYRINKGALGLSKDVSHQVMEFHSQPVQPHSTKSFHELCNELQVPVMPPTMADVCRVIEIYYILKIGLHMEKSGDDIQVEFPFIVATVPHRILTNYVPELIYEPADDHVEGGIYISPEFQLGQVYDGAADLVEDVILYRPVYVCVPRHSSEILSNGHSPSSQTGRQMIMGSVEKNEEQLVSDLAITTERGDGIERVSGHSQSPQLDQKIDDKGKCSTAIVNLDQIKQNAGKIDSSYMQHAGIHSEKNGKKQIQNKKKTEMKETSHKSSSSSAMETESEKNILIERQSVQIESTTDAFSHEGINKKQSSHMEMDSGIELVTSSTIVSRSDYQSHHSTTVSSHQNEQLMLEHKHEKYNQSHLEQKNSYEDSCVVKQESLEKASDLLKRDNTDITKKVDPIHDKTKTVESELSADLQDQSMTEKTIVLVKSSSLQKDKQKLKTDFNNELETNRRETEIVQHTTGTVKNFESTSSSTTLRDITATVECLSQQEVSSNLKLSTESTK